MKTVEKLARAIDPDAWKPLRGKHNAEIRRFLNHVGEKRREQAHKDALAALRALREPDMPMLDAITPDVSDDIAEFERWEASQIFAAMIDAAIQEAEAD